LMVRVAPASTRSVPPVTVKLLRVWLVLTFNVPPLRLTLLVAGIVVPPVRLRRRVAPEIVVSEL
jgi:hypothetical protein